MPSACEVAGPWQYLRCDMQSREALLRMILHIWRPLPIRHAVCALIRDVEADDHNPSVVL